MSKKRKIDLEGRMFQEIWKETYFFCEDNGRPVCLICSQAVAVQKEYNIKRHYEIHAETYDKYTGQLRTEKVNNLALALKKKQPMFTKRSGTDEAVKASYLIANEIAAASKPFSEGEFVKKCMVKAAELVCPEKKQAFASISLSRNTVAERIEDLAGDLNRQLKDKVKSFIAFSIALDESTDINDVAQLGLYIRGVYGSLNIAEEFVELTDGAPCMVGKKAGLVTKLKEKIQKENPTQEFWNFHCILHQEALFGKTLKMDNIMDVVIKTVNFIRAKGLNHRQFEAFLSEKTISHSLPYHTEVRWLSRGAWVRDLAFMVDVTEHLNVLNIKIQGRNKVVTEYYDCIRAFEMKLDLWATQLSQGNPAHFPTLKSVHTAHDKDNMDKYKEKIFGLQNEFQHRFQVFSELEKEFSLFRSPFTASARDVPEELQLELIELQCNTSWKDKFATVTVDIFYQHLGPTFPKMTGFASKILSMFGTTYLCEQAFSVMNINKSNLRFRLTHRHLNDIMRVATAQKLVADVDTLIEEKRCQVSGSRN
ncbi:putative general transcription factor II-I repeat domain-containing protein 2-like [Triplophysa rosa]|uniref:General transcription factor II-I repeat domain-containing protein 2-like n=1 Tax=Triplophysa rosa TaxID=992332 RepID=A0A9W7WJ69_TRIRA|nr:putative general transcription factor II-I repeat domain-containing protein 2-like [Triplophysa rosa]